MAYEKSCYLQHTAIRVKDLQWHIRFFRDAMGMPVSRVAGDPDDPQQVWTVGGMQLVSDKTFEGPEGRMVHLGIMAEDLEACLEEVYKWGVEEMAQGHNWVRLPDGLELEIMQAPQV
jgi:catechol 2,3-dioxygenase-like lactoylglutathione lyase family enzyme